MKTVKPTTYKEILSMIKNDKITKENAESIQKCCDTTTDRDKYEKSIKTDVHRYLNLVPSMKYDHSYGNMKVVAPGILKKTLIKKTEE